MPLQLSKKPFIALIVGSPTSGKTTLTRSIIYHFMKSKYWKRVEVYSKIAKLSGDFSCLPEKHIHDGNLEHLQAYVAKLRNAKEKSGSVPPNCVILDDLMGELGNYESWFLQFCATHRHTNTTIILSTQYIGDSSTVFRSICNYAIFFRQVDKRSLNNLFENFGGYFDNYKAFKKFHDDNLAIENRKHYCIVYDRNKYDKNNYMLFKADLKKDFKLNF